MSSPTRTPPAVARPRRTPPPRSVHDLSFAEAVDRLGDEARAAAVFADLYRRRRPAAEVTAAHPALDVAPTTLVERERTPGRRTTKHLFALPDGNLIETVRIVRRDGHTACVSSQAGCAFGCRFCASGQAGLARHLQPGEIVQQVLALGPRVNRVVFMGIGEPLHNDTNVLAAIRILRERRGLRLPTSGVTISTIGIPAALRRLREEHLRINLTVSLHATTQETRAELIPGARNHDLTEVVARACSWAHRHRRVVTFVYLLLPGVNDTDADVERLIDLLAGAPARVNLMRWNPVEGGPRFRRVDDRRLSHVRRTLAEAGLQVTVRDTQGKDIDAACGQLRLSRGTSAVS